LFSARVLLLDFLDLAGRECGVREDNGVSVIARGLSHTYGELRSLDSIELEALPGEVVALVGPSGCGKSTLLEIASGLRDPSAGTIAVEGSTDAAGRLSHCAYMPQRDLLLPWFSALDNAALALRNRGIGRAAARSQAGELFDRFGLAGFEAARPQELSGGMRQRVAFLRTLVAGKPVLLLDEPFASLDAISRAEMQEWLAGTLSADGRTVLLVSHDLEEALYLADRVLVLTARPGRVVKELRAPDPRAPDRDGAVTDPEFVATREAALRALREGTRASASTVLYAPPGRIKNSGAGEDPR
jgi:ABC-type nitrate/sulfonate/bicarbonate transport system ATPase subunit